MQRITPDLFLTNGFDYVLRGECENTLLFLCAALLNGTEIPEMDGLVRLDKNGSLIQSGQRLSRNPSWKELSFPSRDIIDLEPYRTAWMEAHGYFSNKYGVKPRVPISLQLVCKAYSGNKFHLRSAAVVAEEMLQLKLHAGVQHIWFGDDVFALNHHWVEEFAWELTKRNAVLPFKIQSRADLMSEETVRHLKTAGCAEVWLGVESGSQAVLKRHGQGV